ncbi:peptidoglycan DD-metalloendopeptidase family protein [Streptomyces sp. VRA16 Mangrove soil]|nr:peptidoglycan DD-metalloendopeptidase family protein [Streptomyces sp. VRA16 Mangrove soil]
MSCPRTAGYSRRTALAAPVVEAKEKLVNDRHPSGTAHYAAYDGYSTTSFAADPLFGDMPGDDPYDTGSSPTSHTTSAATAATTAAPGGYDTGSYETGQWYTDPQFQQPYADPYAASYDTGGYDTTAIWGTAGHEQVIDIPAQAGTAGQHTGHTGHTGQTGQWDTTAYATQTFDSPVFGTTVYDTSAYDATQWNSTGVGAGDTGELTTVHDHAAHEHAVHDHTVHEHAVHEHAVHEQMMHEQTPDPYYPSEPDTGSGSGAGSGTEAEADTGSEAGEHPEPEPEPAPARPSRAAARSSRSRRRTPAKRSALLTVAVPSVCVVGIAGVAAASVGIGGDDDKDIQAASAPDASAVKPSAANNKLDTQLADLSQDAGDFADRASRTQERIDLKAKQEADRKKAAEEAKRKEALRPKFALPVKQRGLSAYYGQAGINWMSVHTGIDFPVSYGTPVMAATDGTVRTQWNSAYGNMAIVTAKDGTETWYCHLSAHTVMSGPVKAGDVIARSGNSGNSTGPHLHFEVRPGGGSAIDPLPWLRSHGLDPT